MVMQDNNREYSIEEFQYQQKILMLAQQPKLRERSNPSKLGKILENAHRGFAYQILELEMSIDNPDTSLGLSKLQDITQLVQLYMLGVEVLEGQKHKNYQFFSNKLQDLLKKKIVCQQFKLDMEEIVGNSKALAAKKRITHQQEIQKQTEEHSLRHLSDIVAIAEENVVSCKGIIEGDIRKQQIKIKERIASRERTKQREGSTHSIEKNIVARERQNRYDIENQYYGVPLITSKSVKISKKDSIIEGRPRSGKSEKRENRFEISKDKEIISYRI